MPKKKPSAYKHTRQDAEFVTSATREFSLAYPDELDDVLERLREWMKHPDTEPGLTPLLHILRVLEKKAEQVLEKLGFDSDLSELFWIQEDAGIEAQSAKQVLISAQNLRQAIRENEAERAALEMMRLVFGAIKADMFSVLMTGIRVKQGQTAGGRVPKRKEGIVLAIRKILKTKGPFSREELWRYFARHHDQEQGQKVLKVERYAVYHENGRLFQENGEREDKEPESISKPTFFNYVTQIRPKTKK